MQVELDADDGAGAGDGADMGEGVAFAVVVAVGDHGAVHAEEDDVDRGFGHGGFEVGGDLAAEVFVDVAQRGAGGFGAGADAFDDGVAVGFGEAAPFDEGDVAEHGGLEAATVAEIGAVHEGGAAGGDGGEGVGFGGEGGEEDFHGRDPCGGLSDGFINRSVSVRLRREMR